MFSFTCAADVAGRAHFVSCSESWLVLAGNVGGQIWADWSAGSQLEFEPVVAAGLIAVWSGCPISKDEWSWKKSLNQLCLVGLILTCALLAGVTLFHIFCQIVPTRVKILPAMSI